MNPEERKGHSDEDIDQIVRDTSKKIYDLFIERSSTLFADDDILLWLKEIIGFSLNKLDSGELTDP